MVSCPFYSTLYSRSDKSATYNRYRVRPDLNLYYKQDKSGILILPNLFKKTDKREVMGLESTMRSV